MRVNVPARRVCSAHDLPAAGRRQCGAAAEPQAASAADAAARRLVLAGMLGSLLALAARPARAIGVGQVMPLQVMDTNQGRRQFPSSQARATYVDFWASWCGPCRQSFPWMNEMHAKYGASGLHVVAVNVDAKRELAQEFLVRHPAQFLVAYDPGGALAKALEVKAMPTSLLVDSRGTVLLVHEGFLSKDRAPLEAAIVSAMGTGVAAVKP